MTDNSVYRALIIEDEVAIAQLLKIHLSEIGLSIDVCHDADAGLQMLRKNSYAICLLDWMLPGLQGIELLENLQSQKGQLKIMMLTAKADPESIVRAIESGADDYLTKPFDAQVLIARVRNLLRRTEYENQLKIKSQTEFNLTSAKDQSSNDEIVLDGLIVNVAKHLMVLNREALHLTPSEFKLLASLLKAQGQVLTRDQLIAQIQGDDVNVTGRTVDTHIFTLRKKLGTWSNHIETIRGVGYRILISAQDFSTPSLSKDIKS